MTTLTTYQRALYTIKKLKAALQDQIKRQPIAIVGLSCRFPQAANKNEFWQLLIEGKNAITQLPEGRLMLLKGSKEEELLNSQHPYWSGYLSDIELFDTKFFGITPREALYMDPQQRLLLEVAYEAFEDAGLTTASLAGSDTGVYLGMYASQYISFCQSEAELDALYLSTGNSSSIAANRLSYLFDLRGPSLTLDTACSSSLTALHLAVSHLQNKQCEQALVAGVSLNLLPSINAVLTQAKMLSPDGRCKTFDAGANGYVQGEGVGAVVLKPLAKALQGNDRIYGVIAGTAINQDGKTNGLTAPNGAQQETLLTAAYTTSQIDPTEIGYLECHGTGTFLGDPIEVEALGHVFGRDRSAEQPCWISSVKTNIGHLEPAAGIAGLIKVCLALQQRKIPAHLNFQIPNPHIPFEQYHFKIPKQIHEWPVYGDCRVAGLSSFGFGGSNAHVVLRELKQQEQSVNFSTKEYNSELFTLSAKDPNALQQLVTAWLAHLINHKEISLAAWCYNTHVRRSHFSHRIAIITRDLAHLKKQLKSILQNPTINNEEIFTNQAKTTTISPQVSTADQHITLEKSKALAELYINGYAIDWQELEKERSYPLVDMPLYPWQHKVYWPKVQQSLLPAKQFNSNPLQGKRIASPLADKQFEFIISIEQLPELVDTNNMLHVGYYLEMLSYAVQQITEQQTFTLQNLEFLAPLSIPPATSVKIQLIIKQDGKDKNSFIFYRLHSDESNKWIAHVTGDLLQVNPAQLAIAPLIELKQRSNKFSGNADTFINRIKAMYMPIANTICWTEQYWQGESEILVKYRAPKPKERANQFSLKLHPGIIDGSIQPLFILLDEAIRLPYITSKIGSFQYFGASDKPLYLAAKLHNITPDGKQILGDWYLISEDNFLIAACIGIQLTQLGNQILFTNNAAATLLNKPIDRFELANYPVAEHYSRLLDYLCQQVAMLFKMPVSEIAIDQPLQNMGMDSLMAIALSKFIEEGLGTSYPLQELLQPTSIQQIVRRLLGTDPEKIESDISISLAQETDVNHWVAYRQKNGATKMKLICFPYGGGGASIYQNWSQYLPDKIEICPIQLPGRENRKQEKTIHSWQKLIHELYFALKQEIQMPYAFFGHSFGALIAFEFTRYLQQKGEQLPNYLFASAFPAPHLPITNFHNLQQSLAALPFDINNYEFDKLTDTQLNQVFTVLQQHHLIETKAEFPSFEWLRIMLPLLFADSQLVANYQYIESTPLPLPITAFYGIKDKWINPVDIKEWEKHTSDNFNLHKIAGGHMFIKAEHQQQELLSVLSGIISSSGYS